MLCRIAFAVALFLGTGRTQAAPPYEDDPEIVRLLRGLAPGQSLLLPKVRHFRDGQPVTALGRDGPYSRDYTTKMVHAPDRGTALYSGGNHGFGRTNDVWEFHLGSNSWHRLHDSDGGDHARFKFSLMFYPRMMAKDPNLTLTDKQKLEVDACQKWWVENVVQRDGNFVMKNTGAPLLVGHTWDTLMYDAVNKRLVHGTGAHCANVPWLEHRYRGMPLEQVVAAHGKRADGTPWRRPWTFDPATKKWQPYANASPIAELRGMAGSLLYIPDQQKAVWYYAAQNTPGAPHVMALWDLKADTWEAIHPNDGTAITALALKLKQAPESEQQMVYVPPLKKIVAVQKESTFTYDFPTNRWSRANDAVPFMAHDAKTVFDYDSVAGVCLLADPVRNRLASYDPRTNQWKTLEPACPGMSKPQYGVGKGYYDTGHNVLVVQVATTDRIWVYRHAAK